LEEYQRQYSATIESTFLKLTFNSKEIIMGTCEKFSQRYSNTYSIPKLNGFHQVINAQFSNVRKNIYGMNIKYV